MFFAIVLIYLATMTQSILILLQLHQLNLFQIPLLPTMLEVMTKMTKMKSKKTSSDFNMFFINQIILNATNTWLVFI